MMLIGDEPQSYPSYRDISVSPVQRAGCAHAVTTGEKRLA